MNKTTTGKAEKDMSFWEHLDELRRHILRSLVAILTLAIVFFVFNDWMFRYVIFAPAFPDFPTYRILCNISEWVCLEPIQFTAQAIGFGESFMISFKAAFVLGFIVAFPYIFWEFWKFISPGLFPRERRATRNIVFICSFLFLLGVLFGYYVLAPFSINFLIGFTIPGVENVPTVSSFINYMIMFTAPSGLIFELPIVVYFLTKVGLLTASSMRQYRRHSIIGILTVAMIVTPPDILSQMVVAIPLAILYEISILIAAYEEKQILKREREESFIKE